MNVFLAAADGSREARRLAGGENEQRPNSWTPDGRTLAFSELSPETGWDIWLFSADGTTPPRPFVQTGFNERRAAFSPNGRWMAYESDESGRTEIYVCAFPDPGAKRQISIDGGQQARWNPNDVSSSITTGTK